MFIANNEFIINIKEVSDNSAILTNSWETRRWCVTRSSVTGKRLLRLVVAMTTWRVLSHVSRRTEVNITRVSADQYYWCVTCPVRHVRTGTGRRRKQRPVLLLLYNLYTRTIMTCSLLQGYSLVTAYIQIWREITGPCSFIISYHLILMVYSHFLLIFISKGSLRHRLWIQLYIVSLTMCLCFVVMYRKVDFSPSLI